MIAHLARICAALALLAAWPYAAHAQCVDDLAGLRRLAGEPPLASQWIEIDMDDGKPLHLSLVDGGGALQVRFEKAREGLWAEGSGRVCRVGAYLEVRFAPGRLRAGPAAGWLMRRALDDGASFLLERAPGGELRVRIRGWRGRFAPAP